MKLPLGRLLIAAAPAILFATVSTGLGQQPDAETRQAIQKVIDKVNAAVMSDNPAQLFGEILSDKAYALAMPRPDRPSEAVVLDKKTFCENYSRWLKENRPKRSVHKIESLAVVDSIAYEIGVVEEEDATGKITRQRWLNVLAKEETGWKVVFSTPTIPAGDPRKV